MEIFIVLKIYVNNSKYTQTYVEREKKLLLNILFYLLIHHFKILKAGKKTLFSSK